MKSGFRAIPPKTCSRRILIISQPTPRMELSAAEFSASPGR